MPVLPPNEIRPIESIKPPIQIPAPKPSIQTPNLKLGVTPDISDGHIAIKEQLVPDRSVSVAALRTGHSLRDDTPIDQLVESFEQVLHDHPETDFVVAPEYFFFNDPKSKQPLQFTFSGEEYLPTNGDAELVKGIATLKQLAKNSQTSICIGTVCEAENIEDVLVFHNTAIVIDSNGKIVQLRRKFTGTDSIRFTDEKYNTHDFFWTDENGKYRSHILIPDRGFSPASKEERIMAKAMWSAQDSIKPLNLKSKNGESYTALVGICAEAHDEHFYTQARDAKVDVLALIAREGDAHYTEHSQILLFGELNEGSLTNQMLRWQAEGQTGWQNQLENHREWADKYIKGKNWWFQRNMDYAKHADTISDKGVWLIADAAGEQVGIFPVSRRDSVKTANFTKDYLAALSLV